MTGVACEINLNFVQDRKHFHNLFSFNAPGLVFSKSA